MQRQRLRKLQKVNEQKANYSPGRQRVDDYNTYQPA